MRVAVIADLHGNLTALDAVLADVAAARVDQLVCLGDVAATGPQPHETVARLRSLGCPVVMGNTDADSLRPVRLSSTDEDGRRFWEIDEWCTKQLAPDDLAYMRTFQPTVTMPLGDGATLLCFHGSPRRATESIDVTTPDTALARMFKGFHATVLAGGHTHAPFTRRHGQAVIFNPGSVGLPFEMLDEGARNPPWAEYGMIEWQAGRLNLELRRVPIDIKMVIEAALQSGMPHADWWAHDWR
ncbi:MAG TPA: metallophosphoesterase family protein [Chloroflexota bacterium]|nr:metallophosphoesterase family protein [Chloroflexota bacterium]